DLRISDFSRLCHEIVNAPGIYCNPETNLRFCLIPLGYRNIAHVVSEPHHIKVLCLVPTCCSTRPRADTLSNSFLGSMSNNANPWDAHAREDVAELAVTVSSLIEVHKVHVDR